MSKMNVQAWLLSDESSPLGCRQWPSCCVLTRLHFVCVQGDGGIVGGNGSVGVGRGSKLSGVSSYEGTNLITRTPPS